MRTAQIADQIPSAGVTGFMTGIEIIAAERYRQINEEGWTLEHDDNHVESELAFAAACYAEFAACGFLPGLRKMKRKFVASLWPFDMSWWKPSAGDDINGRISELAKAGALVAAEIDRLQRIES